MPPIASNKLLLLLVLSPLPAILYVMISWVLCFAKTLVVFKILEGVVNIVLLQEQAKFTQVRL